MEERLSVLITVFDKPARDEDAVADLQEGIGGDLRATTVLVSAEGGAQDGRPAAEDAVEGEAGDRGVDPLDLRVQVTGQRLLVSGFECPVRGAHRGDVLRELARSG